MTRTYLVLGSLPYENLNHAMRLANDPTSRAIGSEKVWERVVALTSTSHWFETDLLLREGTAKLNRDWRVA